MNEMNNLQKSLLIVEEDKARKYDHINKSILMHRFSRRYYKRREVIIGACKEQLAVSTVRASYYRRTNRLRLRTILVAALIMLLATISVIAITKPHIYYVIKEKINSWRIIFISENNEIIDNSFNYIKPQIPDGFTIVLEEKLENDYFLSMKDPSGAIINYEQMQPVGTTISVDSEHSNNTTEIVNGVELVISREKNATTFICNDGKYIFQIQGNADEGLLRQMMMTVIDK